uniref:Uncharacterized protein n=1 Tax=Rhizophora mucronata TaxID=61149 RepID=A0A2P2ND78_RHIMU
MLNYLKQFNKTAFQLLAN